MPDRRRRKPATLPLWRSTLLLLSPLVLLSASSGTGAAPQESPFDEPLFRRCINWMLDGTGGALIDNLCVEYYSLPPPSLFLCARKVMTGFKSEADQEGCAILFEEEARKVRAGYVK